MTGRRTLCRRLYRLAGDELLRGKLNGDGTATVGSTRLPAGNSGTAEVTYGIRPEHLSFGNEGDGAQGHGGRGGTGADTMVVARVVGGDKLVAVPITTKCRSCCATVAVKAATPCG